MLASLDACAALPDRQGGLLTRPGCDGSGVARLAPPHRSPRLILVLCAGFALFAGGCAAAEIPFATTPALREAPATAPPASSSPSPTPSPPPTPTRTPGAPVAIGERLYFEDFTRPARWDLQSATSGEASVRDGKLLLSVHEPTITLLQPIPIEPLADFYLEVELRPSVCSPGDEFGLAIRMKPSGGHYRISLICEGAARLLRVLPEQTYALTSVTPSDSIIPGGEGTNRLGIAAEGQHLRLFVNRQPVLEDRDSRLPLGGLALFARPGSGGQTTVAFDNLAVYALAPTPTQAP